MTCGMTDVGCARVARRVRVRRPVGAAVGEDRQHVVADRVGVEGLGEVVAGRRHRRVGRGHHRVEHLRRDEHRHRRALALVLGEVVVEAVVEQVTHEGSQLLDVPDTVDPLPLRAVPVGLGDARPARETRPVGLDELASAVRVGLLNLAHAENSNGSGGFAQTRPAHEIVKIRLTCPYADARSSVPVHIHRRICDRVRPDVGRPGSHGRRPRVVTRRPAPCEIGRASCRERVL